MNAEETLISKEACAGKMESKTAPRVTAEGMRARIKDVQYSWPFQTVTLCNILLDNGYSVRGESACVDPRNFDVEIGKRLAYDNAFNKLWPLFGFVLAEKRQVIPIARVAHEINRAYCQALGDASQPHWEDAPDWQQNSAIGGVLFHMDHPQAGPEASHESWMKQKESDGWIYGEVKDPSRKQHPCMVPFNELPKEQQAKDFLFRAVVHALTK